MTSIWAFARWKPSSRRQRIGRRLRIDRKSQAANERADGALQDAESGRGGPLAGEAGSFHAKGLGRDRAIAAGRQRKL